MQNAKLAVWLNHNGNQAIHVGTLDLRSHGGFCATFEYADSYLELARQGKAFALDPINMPLQKGEIYTESPYEKLGALFDAAPDAWGRYVMASSEGVEKLDEPDVLMLGKGSGVGCIVFSKNAPSPEQDGVQIIKLPEYPSDKELASLAQAALDLDRGKTPDSLVMEKLLSSWDIGGARPKFVVQDDQGIEWIVKIGRESDQFDRQRDEWENLEIARKIGMRVPNTQLREYAPGQFALMVQRFDRISAHESPSGIAQKLHYISAVSLISPPASFEKRMLDTNEGYAHFSYARLLQSIKKVSANPVRDTLELYARMCLNVHLKNTDDHLKNHGFLAEPWQEGKPMQYRLSPLFDVAQQVQNGPDQLHLLHLSKQDGRKASPQALEWAAEEFGIRAEQAAAIREKVASVVQEHKFQKEQPIPQRTKEKRKVFKP